MKFSHVTSQQHTHTHTHTHSLTHSLSTDRTFGIIEDVGEHKDHTADPRKVYFGVKVCDGNRYLIKTFSLQHRPFLGTTTMDPELSIISANMAQVLRALSLLSYLPFYLSSHAPFLSPLMRPSYLPSHAPCAISSLAPCYLSSHACTVVPISPLMRPSCLSSHAHFLSLLFLMRPSPTHNFSLC